MARRVAQQVPDRQLDQRLVDGRDEVGDDDTGPLLAAARWETRAREAESQVKSLARELDRANEVAGRHTLGHFDLPMRNHSLTLDGESIVENGVLQGELA